MVKLHSRGKILRFYLAIAFVISVVLTILFKIPFSSSFPFVSFLYIFHTKKNPYTKGSATENIKNINNKKNYLKYNFRHSIYFFFVSPPCAACDRSLGHSPAYLEESCTCKQLKINSATFTYPFEFG